MFTQIPHTLIHLLVTVIASLTKSKWSKRKTTVELSQRRKRADHYVGIILAHRLRRWPSITPTLGELVILYHKSILQSARFLNCIHIRKSISLTYLVLWDENIDGNNDPMPVSCWSTVCDAGPTWNRHWVRVQCGLGGHQEDNIIMDMMSISDEPLWQLV